MKRREMISLVAGLIVGLFAGMVLIGSSDSLREDLFGSAVDNDSSSNASVSADEMVYYQADLASVQAWLATQYPDLEPEALTSAVDNLASLADSEDLAGDVTSTEVEAELDMVLPRTYQALSGADYEDEVKVDPDLGIEVCLGIDQNPTMGTRILIYMITPAEQTKDLELPEGWELLDGSRDNDLFWMPIACYPTEEDLAAADNK